MNLDSAPTFGYATSAEAQAMGARWTDVNNPFVQRVTWGFPCLYKHQRKIIEELMPQGAWVAGSFPNFAGKCQPCSMVIPTPHGPREFGSLEVGDVIWDRNGLPCRVLAVFEKGKMQTHDFFFGNGERLHTRATGDHKWFYLRHSRRFENDCRTFGKYQVWDTDRILREQGAVSTPQKRGAMPLCLPVQYATRTDLVLDPYFVGAIIGNGCLVGTTPMFSSADEDTLTRVRSALPEDYILVHNGQYDWRVTRPNNKRKENIVTTHLRHLGLMGTRSETKFIPHSYMVGDVQQRLDLLRGLMDTDGYCCDRGMLEYSTASEQLSRDFIELVASLGGRTFCRSRETHYTGNDGVRVPCQLSYRISVKFPREFVPFYCKRKLDRWIANADVSNNNRLVYEIQPYGMEECRCIMVDSSDQSYLCNDYLVTHNTSLMLPLFGLSVMAAFPGSIVYTTAGSENQIKDQLFKNLESRCRPFESKGWKVSTSALTVTAPSICGLPPSKWISRVPRDALTGEGYHAGVERDSRGRWHYLPLFAAIDEAKSVGVEVFEMMSRLIPTWFLAISTPNVDSGEFFNAVDPETLHEGDEGVEVLEPEGLANGGLTGTPREG